MLCSVDFNNSVAVLTLLYLLLAHTGRARCSHSEHVPVLNPEVLSCQYLCTMLLSMFFLTLTILSLFLLSLQAPLFATYCKFFPLSYRVPTFYPSTSPTFSCPTLSVSIPQVTILEKQPSTSCQAPWDLRKALFQACIHTPWCPWPRLTY